MNFNSFKKLTAWLLGLSVLLTSLMACSEISEPGDLLNETQISGNGLFTETDNDTGGENADNCCLSVAYPQFEAVFSPFFASAAADMDVVALTQVPLLTLDRSGLVLQRAANGESSAFAGQNYDYEGLANVRIEKDSEADCTRYTFKLREDVRFSDGQPLTADDLIFSLYVYLDPAYDGIATISSLDIVGLKDYQTQTTEDVRLKYEQMYRSIEAAGEAHVWTDEDTWTKEQQIFFWKNLEEVWTADVQAIVDTVYSDYAEAYAQDTLGKTAADLAENPQYKVALAMVLWGFGEIEEAQLVTPTGKRFNLKADQWPQVSDFYDEVKSKYEGNYRIYWEIEKVDDSSVESVALSQFIQNYGPQDEAMGGPGIKEIEGIKKKGPYEVEVTLNGYSTEAIYRFAIELAPLHFYGDLAQYDYEARRFGHPFGDLSSIKAKNAFAFGAGPYVFEAYEHGTIYFSANPNYYKGEALIPEIQFKQIPDADVMSALAEGEVDLTASGFNESVVKSIKAANENGRLQGNQLHTLTVDKLSYGYIGINAETVNVGGVPDSEASKNLRRALATLFSVYRDTAVENYFGERAKVINYPFSASSWVTPNEGDEHYQMAFSKAVDGTELYTSQMDDDARYKAALKAAKDYLLSAGYLYDENVDKFTAAPEGAQMSYEAILVLDAEGDHPNRAIFKKVKAALSDLGIELVIREEADGDVLWDQIRKETQEIWTAAWWINIDPDLFKAYHSANVVGEVQSSESNDYHIRDKTLDELILEARKSIDLSFRKATLLKAWDIIKSWAVEIPVYQVQTAYVFNAERIDIESLAPAQTTFYNWIRDVDKIRLK